jgi:ferredoxin-NADP reductase
MAEWRAGKVVSFERLSPVLALFRMQPEAGRSFPEYKAGQYIALRREDCKLTRRVMGPDQKPHYLPDVDEQGQPKLGAVAHSYSISSAPFETAGGGELEFYVVLERGENEYPGRLTESFFRMEPGGDDRVSYVERIAGDFTLEKRAAAARSVVMVGTGTGLAPFAAMVKQLDHEAAAGRRDGVRYTLLHANRTFEELAHHREFLAIEEAGRIDFAYVASVSRPTDRDRQDPRLGQGRANNVLRQLLGLPLREEEELAEAEARGHGAAEAQQALARTTRPLLPAATTAEALRARMDAAAETVVLTCGNPSSMEDIKRIAERAGFRFEKEDWKLVLPART